MGLLGEKPNRFNCYILKILISLGEQPPESLSGVVQGVVVEYNMPDKGLDIVAAYTDHTAPHTRKTAHQPDGL